MASRLSDSHILAQERLRALLKRLLTQAWGSLPGYDEEDVAPWLKTVVPLVLAGQRQSVALTNAYVARALARPPLEINPDEVIGRVRGNTTPEQAYRRPFVTIWTALQAGTAWADAVNQGLERATSTGDMDVQMASRGTFAALQDADPGIRGYQRAADGNACEFCLLVDGAFVKSADAMPLHNHCGCSLEPVLDDVTPTPLPEGVAVHEHGELGLVLGDPAHDFTSAADV
jgi:hypothetical protein